ncbi:MAG: Alpha-galactosidase [Lacunisphaera sp.]|nr:Alpha-galactosidase [Lacunisphaera sp.]
MSFTPLHFFILSFALSRVADLAAAPVVSTGSMPDYRDRILTPPPGAQPRINSARIFGVRPGSPFLFRIAATGTRPLIYSASALPAGLTLDPATGIITGMLAQSGEHRVQVGAANAHGAATGELRIVAGDTLALTPPMGWNSWYCWSESVSQENVAAMAEVMAEKLADHGWTYVNIDDCWQGRRGGPHLAIQPNEKFPSIAALAGKIHGLGLKFGIYSTPWMGSYAGFIGGSAESPAGDFITVPVVPEAERSQPSQIFGRSPGSALRQAQRIGPYQLTDRDALQYAAWGVDYVKYDWKNSTFTSPPMVQPVRRTDQPKTPESIARLDAELRATPRDLVLSLSPIADWANRDDLAQHANLWRITRDIKADWESLNHVFELGDWFAYTKPGHWPDPDMLQVGAMGVVNAQNRTLRPSPLTADEQYTQMSLWCLLSAPLLLSCDLTALDPFTLSLITNDEVIELDQDPLGQPAKRVAKAGDLEVWRKPLGDGTVAVGLFNRGPVPMPVTAQWADLGLTGAQLVRDLWRQQDVATAGGSFTTPVNSHGVVLLRLQPAPVDGQLTRLRLFTPAWRDIGPLTPQEAGKKFPIVLGHLDPRPFHEGNPAARCFKYILGPYVDKAQLDQLPREALARDAQGNFVKARDWANWLVVPDNPKWLDHLRELVPQLMASDFDGLFVDSMGTAPVASNYTLTAALNPRTGKPYTRAEWLAAERVMLQAIRAALPAGKQVTLNGLAQGTRYWTEPEADSPRVLLPAVDGAMSESTWRDAKALLDAWPTPGRWMLDVRMIQDVERRGLMGFWWTKCWGDGNTSKHEPEAAALLPQWRRFALASYLLAAGPHSYFNFDTEKNDQPRSNAAEYFPEYDAPLGHALDAMQPLGSTGAFARRFSGGVVLVNPTAQPVGAVELPWPELRAVALNSAGEGRTYSGRFDLPAHTGLLLTLP